MQYLAFIPAFFSQHFWNAFFSIANNSCFDFSFISSSYLLSLVLWRGKNQRRPSPVNMLVEAWLRLFHTQASMCELVRYHDTKSMIGFSTILCITLRLYSLLTVQPCGRLRLKVLDHKTCTSSFRKTVQSWLIFPLFHKKLSERVVLSAIWNRLIFYVP